MTHDAFIDPDLHLQAQARAAHLDAKYRDLAASVLSVMKDVEEIAVYHLDTDCSARAMLLKLVRTFRLAVRT